MLNSLFKHGWQSESAETRLLAVNKMDGLNSANQVILAELAAQDSARQVRFAALHKITNPTTLLQIYRSHQDQATQTLAEQMFAKLIGAKSDITEQQLSVLLNAEPSAQILIVKYAKYADLRLKLLTQLSEAQQANIIAEIEYADTRKCIAQNLNSIDTLEVARNQLKGKDKNSEKIIKNKLDSIRAEQQRVANNEQTALHLCEKMEYIANHKEWRPEFSGQISVWSQRWDDMDFAPNTTISRRYNEAYTIATKELAHRATIQQAENSHAHLLEHFTALTHALAGEDLHALSQQQSKYLATINSGINDWQHHNKVVEATPAQAIKFNRLHRALSSALVCLQSVLENDDTAAEIEKALANLYWPDSYPSLVFTQAVRDKLTRLTTDNKKAAQVASAKLDKLHKRIHRLLGVSKQGNLAQSKRELNAISKAIEGYSGKDRSILDERLVKANDVVAQMTDWNNFVTEPKYLELCLSMEALINAKRSPDKLAKKIKSLQNQWKDVGFSEKADEHWQRFKKAADAAYEPCDQHFKERRKSQLENLAQREPFLLQMQHLLENTDWHNAPDYKSIETTLRKIMQDWRKIKDVDQRGGQKQWQKLTKLKSKIDEKLDLVYNANIELKMHIIAQTKSLLDAEINEQSLSKLQLYQSRWKQVGITRRKQDQAAWKTFKQDSDAVFAKIQHLRKQLRTEEDKQINVYREIINKIIALSKTATDLGTADKEFASLQSDYQQLPPLPNNLPEKLLKKLALDYQRSENLYTKSRDRLLQARRSKILDALKLKAEQCAKLELLSDQNILEDQDKLLLEINRIDITDQQIAQQFKSRIDTLFDNNRHDASDVRRRLCIDLEILLDVESPPEDKAFRMEIQLNRLKNKGLGQGVRLNKQNVEQLLIDWLCLPGAGIDHHHSLNDRFDQLYQQI